MPSCNKWFLFILTYLLSTGTDLVRAQAPTPLHFKPITINDGLSQGYVSGITQDKQGFMWFATGDGLNKYDGYTFTVYHHNPDDPTSIASDDITYLFEDSQQRLWIATRNNGLDYFDRENNVFYHFRSVNEQSLLSDKVGVMGEDKTGALWICTDLGIDRMVISANSNSSPAKDFFSHHQVRVTHIRADTTFTKQSPEILIRASYFSDSRGHIYIATANRIYELLFNANNTYRFIEKFETRTVHADFLPVLQEDTASNSLFMFGESVIRFPDHNFNQPSTLYNFSKYIPGHVSMIDKNQMIWMAENGGLKRIHISGREEWNHVPADPSQAMALGVTTCMFSDRQGVLWIGTGGYGILKYDPEKEQFHHILPNTKQYQVLEIEPGTIMTNNFQKIKLDKNQAPRLQNDALPNSLKQRLLLHNVISFTKDTSGVLWMPDGKSIYSYNLKTKEEHIFHVLPENIPGKVYPLYADRKNRYWFGLKQQFFRLQLPADYSAINYPLKVSDFEADFLQVIYEDGDTLWLGTMHGLFRYNILKNSIEEKYYFQPDDSTSLSNNFIYSICNDGKAPTHYLWIGTKGGGLNRLDKATGKFVRYNTKNGLANNVVYGILPGDDGNLWLSTNKGLSAFDPDTRQFRNYDARDGLQSNEFNRYAFCKTSNGLLVFGGMNGINYFDPKEVKPLEPPDVVFTEFRLFNKPVNIKDPGAPLKKSIDYTKEITLQYRQNVLTFHFAAMDYRREGNIVYRYKMNGFDNDWIYAGSTHEATYTNLDPGRYRFVVQASFERNIWRDDKQKSIQLVILTPWYRTWWCYLLVIATTMAIIYAMYRFRLYQLKRLDSMRNRIGRDLHDEVGSSLSAISIYSKIMQEQMSSVDLDNKPLINKIDDFATEVMASMNDIIWNINTKNDTFDRIIIRMREQATQLLEAKGYTVYFNFDRALSRMKLHMDRRREFYLIYKEAINNIAKYAAGENVWISVSVQHSVIELSIKDDGRGFDTNKMRNNGSGLMNMRHRAETLKGDIIVHSSPGSGATVILKFNVG